MKSARRHPHFQAIRKVHTSAFLKPLRSRFLATRKRCRVFAPIESLILCRTARCVEAGQAI